LVQGKADGSHLKTLTKLDKVATICFSRIAIKRNHIIGDPTIADAVCDRLVHHGYKIELKGDSIRKTKK
jgi:DNA replication protein DnaC